MDSRPTKQEILQKYRDRIDADDFELLLTDTFPSPQELQQDKSWLVYLGPLKDCWIFLKRTLKGPVAVIALFGSFCSGVEKLSDAVHIAYDAIAPIVVAAGKNLDKPANEFAIAFPEIGQSSPPDFTTPAHPSSKIFSDLLPQSGVVPYSHEWRPFA